MPARGRKQFKFEISLSVLNHLGRNLYRNFITVIGEAVSNAWDAGADTVDIDISLDKNTFSIKDNGEGMDANDFQNKFLKVGYSKRQDGSQERGDGRPFIGAKGIGKLALLSCADTVSIFSKKLGAEYVGGVIDNGELDDALSKNKTTNQYKLTALDHERIAKLKKDHNEGTIIVFDGLKENLKRTSVPQLRKLLALSFKFALIDKKFEIRVDGDPVTEADLSDLAKATEFLWTLDGYEDAFTESCTELKEKVVPLEQEGLKIRGFFATVDFPSKLKITGTDERATIDLFVNGRLREKNVIRHMPTQRIVENYLYGQIHYNDLDRPNADPFTSSREGIVDDDVLFLALKKDLKVYLQKVIDQWDKLRLARGKSGDDENPRKSRKERKALDMYNIAKTEYQTKDSKNKDIVDKWLHSLQADATFNLQAYVDCFLSENLIRKYIDHQSLTVQNKELQDAQKWKSKEATAKAVANISFDIRADSNILSYLDMDALAVTAEGSKTSNSNQSLWLDAMRYKPARNAVGHTGLLSSTAKTDLNTTHENIKGRLRTMLSKPKPQKES